MSRSFSRKWYSLGPWVFREFLHQYCRVILLLFAANWTVHCLGISGLSGGPGDLPGSSSFKAARQGRRLVHSPTSPLPPVSTRSAQSTTLQRHSQRDEDALQLEEQIFGQRGYQGDSYFFGLDDRSTVYGEFLWRWSFIHLLNPVLAQCALLCCMVQQDLVLPYNLCV